MALSFGFYDSMNGDRTYNAEQFSRFFDGIISDGVYKAVGSKFAVSPGSGMTVVVGSGRAWFDHTWTYNDSGLNVTLPAAHATLPRIDSIILVVDEQSRANQITYKQGTAASSPVVPTLTNNETYHEYRIANIAVAPTVTSIVASNITQIVGTVETPYAMLTDMNVDYNSLNNLPSINGITLTGNKTTTNLQISYDNLTNRPSINGVTLTGNKTTANLQISYNDLLNKPSLATVATSGSYDSLSNRPQINGITLTGNKTTANLNISYNDLTNKPTLNGQTITGAMTWNPGALNSTVATINHATVNWGYTTSEMSGPVLRYTYNLPTPKNGRTIRKILISYDRGLNDNARISFAGDVSKAGKSADVCYAIITKSTNPISGLDTYFVQNVGGIFENGLESKAVSTIHYYYNRSADIDTDTDIEDPYVIFGQDRSVANGFQVHYPCDIRFGMVYWGTDNVLHYAMQEYYCDPNESYMATSNNVSFKVVVLE